MELPIWIKIVLLFHLKFIRSNNTPLFYTFSAWLGSVLMVWISDGSGKKVNCDKFPPGYYEMLDTDQKIVWSFWAVDSELKQLYCLSQVLNHKTVMWKKCKIIRSSCWVCSIQLIDWIMYSGSIHWGGCHEVVEVNNYIPKTVWGDDHGKPSKAACNIVLEYLSGKPRFLG